MEDEMVRACSTHGRDAYKMLVRKYEGMRQVERPRHRWEDIIMDLKEIR
jgi:hypothetical protein